MKKLFGKSQNGRSRVFNLLLPFFLVLVFTVSCFFSISAFLSKRSRNLQKLKNPVAEQGEVIGRFLTYIVKPGDTFQSIMDGFGIPASEAFESYRSLASIGLSSIFPGDSVVCTINPDNKLSSFSMLTRLQCWYHLQRDDNALTAEKEPLATERRLCSVKGTLSSSLSEDLNELGVGDAVVSKLADIFAWDINFFVDPRKGDTFEVVFEQLYREGRFVTYGDVLAAKYTNNGETHYAYAVPEADGRLVYYNNKGASLQKQFLKAPLKYKRISSGYSPNRRHPVLGIVRPHLGIDYAAPTGTQVFAAADGNVSFAGVNGGYGKYVTIRHGNAFETSYGHLHQISRGIRTGVRVHQGELIGLVGSTGLSTGPHLDYRMRKGGRYINPQTLNLPSRESLPESEMPILEAAIGRCDSLIAACNAGQEYVIATTEISPPPDSGVRYIKVSMPQPGKGAHDKSGSY
jgi:murein DD-endopeptidase MepM/ murein hydrolase activator NlpD